jgi:hypothetical protein
MRARAKFEGIIISRYGNINGQDERENSPKFIEQALKAGWHVCAEVVFHNGAFLLPHAEINGHSFTPVPPSCFMFSGEQPTLTSAHFIWTPGPHTLTDRAIAYLPETMPKEWLENSEPAGLCTDQPAQYI